jgi:hypothetical protein
MDPLGYVRNIVLPQLEAFADEGVPRILDAFARIDAEAEQYAGQMFQSYGNSPAHEGSSELSEFADEAINQGTQYYSMLEDLRQAITNLLAAGFYHLYEQHFAKLKLILTGVGRTVPSLEGAPTWPQIDELRLLTNTVKHADGSSARQLRARRPELFVRPVLRGSPLEAHILSQPCASENPLGGTDLFVAAADLSNYRDTVREMWVWLQLQL